MSETPAESNQKPLTTPNLLHNLLWNLAIPAGVGFIVLVMEYRSGLFVSPTESDNTASLYHYWLLFSALTLVVSALFAKDTVKAWLRPHRYVREQFALLALLVTSSLAFVLATSVISGIMPWSVPYLLIQYFKGVSVAQPDVRWTDFGLLLALYIMIIGAFNRQHKKWPGLKSIEQYRLEQRGEAANLFIEGFGELRRLLRRGPALKVYSESSSKQLVPQLEPVTDLLVWKDQVKQMILLSSSSYGFDADTGWHDREHCWVGSNVNTGDLIFLYPHQGEISKAELGRFLEYTDRIAQSENRRIGEIIVATKGDLSRPIEVWKNLPIRYETEASLLDGLVNFKDYINEIKRRALVNQLPDSDLTLNDVYVPSHFLLPDGTKFDISIETYLNTWVADVSHRQLALLGEYGQGKSTATLMWAYHVITGARNLPGRIPILIELRGTSPRNLTPLSLLGAWSVHYNINAQALMRLHIAGRLVIIFEGFDEMALVGDAEMRLKHFRTLWQFAYPKAKILITGRPNFFLDEEEMTAALGISKPVGDRPYCDPLRLVPFNPEQIRDALRAYKPTVHEQIYALVTKNPRFLDLVSRPSLLHIVAVLWERERLFEKVDQLTSAFVMDLFIRHSYRRQGLKEFDSPDFMALTTMEREYFMTGIASYMAAESLPNQITVAQLGDVITDLINSIPDSVSTESSAISGETTQPLLTRLRGREDGAEHVKTDVRACGLLIDDPATPGTFRFGHKSFMEYLFAAVVAERIQSTESEKARAVLSATGARIENLLSLPVAIDFLSEMLVGNRDVTAAEQTAKELSTAKHLFRIILMGRSSGINWLRGAVFLEVLIFCTSRGQTKTIQLLVRSVPMMILALISLIPMLAAYSSVSKNTSAPAIAIESTALTAMLLTGVTFMAFFIMPNPIVKSKFQLWTQLCEKLGIQNKVLHKVVGTIHIPWIREKSLDYHISMQDILGGVSDR